MNKVPKDLRQAHNNNFHLLRHIAALFVLYAHAVTAYGNREFINQLSAGRVELSRVGVQIFFIISGYLVTKSLLYSNNRLIFVRKRFLRLWPALFTVTFFLSFVLGPLYTSLSIKDYFYSGQMWIFFGRNILFMPVYQLPGVFKGSCVNCTFWTLFLEVICYSLLLVAGKKLLLKYQNLISFLWVIIIVVLYLFPLTIVLLNRIPYFHYLLNDLIALFFSAAIWLINTQYRKIPKKTIYITALAVYICTCFSPGFNNDFVFVKHVALSLFIIEFGRSKSLFKWPAFDISYGIYLIGFSVQMVLLYHASNTPIPALKLFLFTFIITIPLAFALWFGIEKPTLLLK